MEFKRVGVIGCGTIGCGWATFFAMKGLETRLFDQQPASLEKAYEKVKQNLQTLIGLGELNQEQADKAIENIYIGKSMEDALEGVTFVQESIYEDYDAKKALFKQLDQILDENVIIATSSSGLLMTEIQTAVERFPERCLIGHPINPVFLVPLVEIVPGKQTKPEYMVTTRAFYESIGKVPVTLKKEVPGYLENRLTAALYREAIDLAINDVASVEDIDKTIWAGPGLRYELMGPLLIYHLGGGEGGTRYFIDHLGTALTQWWEDMNTWTKIPEGAADILEKGVEEAMKDKSIADMCAWRDKKLVELIRAADVQNNPCF